MGAPAFDGFRFVSDDGRYSLAFHGKLDNDWAFFSADEDVEVASAPFSNGTEFRRARLGLSGRMEDWLRFKAIFDFADDGSGFRDIYVEPRDVLGIDAVRLGHFKEPFGLENLTSSTAISFLERSLPTAFAPGRNVGAMALESFAGKRATWAAGGFRETDSNAFGQDADAGQEFGATARVTCLPWYQDKGARLAHLGLSASYRNPDDGLVRFREQPEAHLAPDLVDTGLLPAGSLQLGMVEGALVAGPWSVLAELARAQVDAPADRDPAFTAYSIQGSWFVTGEHRRYDRDEGTFAGISPRSAFAGGHGTGAWELALRYSSLDLNDRGVAGGELRDLGFGVNWYLDDNLRIQVNYIIADLVSFGNARILEFRFHLDW